VRTVDPIDHLVVTVESPIHTVLTVSAGARPVSVPILPGKPVTFNLRTRGVRGLASYAYLLSASSTEAFVPHMLNPASQDYRNLGALLRFSAVTAARP
jgi:hypothetical protein